MASTYETRTLVADSNGRAEIGGIGYGIEIVDGGRYGRENIISFGVDGQTGGGSFDGDRMMRCVSGARLAVNFQGASLLSPSITAHDTVVVRIARVPDISWTDGDAAGKSRKLWLARSDAPLAMPMNTWSNLVNTITPPWGDRYTTTEDLDVFTWWNGWISGDNTFNVYVFANANPNAIGSTPCLVQDWAARARPAIPFGAPYSGGHIVDFTSGTGALSGAGSSTVAPVPIGNLEVWAYANGGPVNLQYAIGVRG